MADSIWQTIFGKGNVIDKGVDLVDKSFYTDQEKAEMKKELLKAYQPFKLIQRVLATTVALAFVAVVFIEISLVIMGLWFKEATEVAMQVNSLEVVSMLGWSFMAVISLYFTGGVMDSMFRGKK